MEAIVGILGLLILITQIFIIVNLMKLGEISSQVDRLLAILAAVATKQGVTQDDILKAWGVETKAAPQEEKEDKEKKGKKKDKKS